MRALGTVYRYWLTIVFLAIVVQVMAAAYGAFYTAEKVDKGVVNEKTFDHGFDFHTGLGYFIFLGAVILFVLALAARLGKRRVLLALAVPVGVAVQIVLAWISEGTHAVGVLHGLNALALFAFTGYLTGEAWRAARSKTPEGWRPVTAE